MSHEANAFAYALGAPPPPCEECAHKRGIWCTVSKYPGEEQRFFRCTTERGDDDPIHSCTEAGLRFTPKSPAVSP
jgi:hypothetical protein